MDTKKIETMDILIAAIKNLIMSMSSDIQNFQDTNLFKKKEFQHSMEDYYDLWNTLDVDGNELEIKLANLADMIEF